MKEKQLKINVVLNIIKNICSIIFPLITFPYASRILMAENLGKIGFSSSVVSYFSLIASLGISTYAIRECSKIRNDKEGLSKLSSELFSINLCSTVFAYICLAISFIFVRAFDNYRILIIIQSSSLLFTALGADWINSAMEDFRYITIRSIIFQVLSIAAMFIFVRTSDDYYIYAIISVVAAVGASVSNIVYRRKYCKMHFTFSVNLKKHIKPIMLLFSVVLVQQIYVNSDVLILGFFRADEEIGWYQASVKIYNIVQTLISAVTISVLPRMAGLFAKEDYKSVNDNLSYATNFVVSLGLPCLIGIVFLAPEAITILSGDTYINAVPSLRLLMVALACSFVGGLMGNLILIPSGKERITLISSIISATVNIVLNLILIPYWGLNAAAFTTFLSMLIGAVFKIPFMPKEIHLNNKRKMFTGPIVGSVLIIGICILFHLLIDELILRTIISVGASVVVYFAILIIFKNELGMSITNIIKKIFYKTFKKSN